MSEKKTIQINPELFKIQNVSRKKKGDTNPPKIKLKSTFNKQNNRTLRKNVLKMIREKQQESYQKIFNSTAPKAPTDNHAKEFNKEFDDTVQFFSSLSTKIKENPKEQPAVTPHNITFKNTSTKSSSITPIIDSFDTPMESFDMPIETDVFNSNIPTTLILEPPKYGCLKNGSLPTWRNYTRKNGEITDYTPIPLHDTEISQKMEKYYQDH